MSGYLLAVITEKPCPDIREFCSRYERDDAPVRRFIDKTEEALGSWKTPEKLFRLPNGRWRRLSAMSAEKTAFTRSEQEIVELYYPVAMKSPEEMGVPFSRYCQERLELVRDESDPERYGIYEPEEDMGRFDWLEPLPIDFLLQGGIPKDDIFEGELPDGSKVFSARVSDVADALRCDSEKNANEMTRLFRQFAEDPSSIHPEILLRELTILEAAESEEDAALMKYGFSADAVITPEGLWDPGAPESESLASWNTNFRSRYWKPYIDCYVTFAEARCW